MSIQYALIGYFRTLPFNFLFTHRNSVLHIEKLKIQFLAIQKYFLLIFRFKVLSITMRPKLSNKALLLWLSYLLAIITSSNAFLVPSLGNADNIVRTTTKTTKKPIFMAGSDESDNRNFPDSLQARTCIRTFLTQRAIQSFIHLLVSCRDPHTVKWLESNLECSNLYEYHGTGAFNMTNLGSWDGLLIGLLKLPKEVMVVSTKRRSPFNGSPNLSKNREKNPYLEDRYLEFEIDIEPPSIISRIVSVREQIAAEWNVDLDTLITANDMILTSYFHNQELDRYDEDEGKNNYIVSGENDDFDDGMSKDNDDNTLDVEKLTVPYSDHHLSSSPSSSSIRHRNTFDRHNTMLMFSNSNAFIEHASSPIRKENFDLLILLSTQESIHRVLQEYSKTGMGDDDERETCLLDWLRDFYVTRLSNYFDGHHQRFGSADDFLEELLLTPPSVKKLKNKKIGFIDPLRVAEDIIRMRTQVAMEWKEIIEGTTTEHILIRKELLAKQMMGSSNESPFALDEEKQENIYDGSIISNEAFE